MHNAAIADDFVPPGIKDGPMPGATCASFAISFFIDLQSARERYKSISGRGVDVVARFGGSIGEILLGEADGLMNQPAPSGHFDLHPEDGVALHGRVTGYNAAAV
jgi:hypothetical protein